MTVFYHGISFCISGYILLQLMNFKNLEFIFYLHGCIIGMKHQIKKKPHLFLYNFMASALQIVQTSCVNRLK